MKELNTEIIERYNKGETASRIGKTLGVSRSTARRWLMQSGVKMRTNAEAHYRNLKISDGDLVNRYVTDVQATSKIAREEGVAPVTVRAHLTGLGVKIRTSAEAHLRKLRILDSELAERYANDNRAVSKIAREWGVSSVAVYNRLKKIGVKLHVSHGGFNKQGYHRQSIAGKTTYTHRRIMGVPTGDPRVVHHIDGDRGNFKRSNLHIFASHGAHSKYHGMARKALKKAA